MNHKYPLHDMMNMMPYFFAACCAIGLCMCQTAEGKIRIEAAVGEPFGVGRVILDAPAGLDNNAVETHFISVSDSLGRVHYPAVRFTEPLGIVREILGAPKPTMPTELHFHFLFTGAERLEVTLHTPTPLTVTVQPLQRPALQRRLMRAWWTRYKSAARKQKIEGDYLPVIETYLTHMLAGRLGLAPPFATNEMDTGEALAMLLGTEKLRLQLMRDTLRSTQSRDEPTNQPLPTPVDWASPELKAVRDDVRIEPIANYVPEECFYIRFAQFPNYVWLRKLLEEYGGDLSRMVALRGTDQQLNSRVEQQLGLRETTLSRMLGDKVISDVAMIGRDTFLREGAAIGILFEAKNEFLKSELLNQRKQRAKELEDRGAKVETITLAGQPVSFASTPNHELRSFQARSGNYHLVTNCQEIATRFLQCAEGIHTLADSQEFRYARSVMPLAEDNTIFVYLSRRFFEGLLSPRYQIELYRRLESVTDATLIELAVLAASGEGLSSAPITMPSLVANGFLPTRVDRRVDRSMTQVRGSRVFDSIRGERGTYLPIPDTPLAGVTTTEAQRFERVRDFYARRWQQLHPVLIGLRRTALDDSTERVDVQARMLPLNTDQYTMLTRIFGPPNNVRIRPPENDIVSIQAYVGDENTSIPSHHLYFGVRDTAPRKAYSERRLLKSLQVLRTAPAYLAAWPRPELLDRFGFTGRPVGDGYRRMLLGLYRLNTPNGFSLLSFDPQILAEVQHELISEESEDRAQLRVEVGDVKNSQFGNWANDLDFQRAWETSLGNVHLLHVVTQQFHIPIGDAKTIAERILDASLICPLDGEYELVEDQHGSRWSSSVGVAGKEQASQDYVSPLMNWLRGLQASMTIEEDRVVASGVLDIQRADMSEGGIKLPFFNFGLGGKANPPKPDEAAGAEQPAVEAKEGAESLPPPRPVPATE